MSAQLGITLVKKMVYRGDTEEEWSNTYWFTGASPPSTLAEAKSAVDALAQEEEAIYLSSSGLARAYVYLDNALHHPADFAIDAADVAPPRVYAGQLSIGAGTYPAGDQAAWLRWATARTTSKGRTIFLRKYYHDVPTTATTKAGADSILAAWGTAADEFLTDLKSGDFWGFGTLSGRAQADVLGSTKHSTFITTRTLERRGKRP